MIAPARVVETTFFTVENTDLEHFSPEDAIVLIRDLLWAEAARLGLPLSKIQISSQVNVPDGGIDAEVADGISGDLIQRGFTAYQIKAGQSFAVNRKSAIQEELFGDARKVSREHLKPRIRKCLEQHGTYILICTGTDPPSTDEGKSHLIECFQACGFPTPKVQILTQHKLIGFISKYPSIALRVNRRPGLKLQAHASWSQDAEMQKLFQNGQPQEEFINDLRAALRNATAAVHIHIHGEAGVGKTRLVLEATRADDVAPLVLYSDTPAEIMRGDLMSALLQTDSTLSVILVVDEANRDARTRIWDKLKLRGARIRLITIYNEWESATDTPLLAAPPLGKDEITRIIETYNVPKDQAERWADLCSGSPRVAHVIGSNLKNNPEDLLRVPDTVNIWDRYVFGADDQKSPAAEERLVVLRHTALFKRFGFEEPVLAEAKAIAALIQKGFPQITWPKFQAIIVDLKRRHILQGETTLYITPKALHIKLWTDWWEAHGRGFILEEFIKELPAALVQWFMEMFRYAEQSQAARQVVTKLLGADGPFGNDEFFSSKLGGDFFFTLTDVNPAEALACLERTIGNWSREKLMGFGDGRRGVIYALERIAIWKNLFVRAATILLKLADAENETWANNATGVFAELFSPGPGQVAPTEASPEERFPVLKQALQSFRTSERSVGLRACNEAFETRHFSRTSGPENQGFKAPPKLWAPKTYGEWFAGYRLVWNFLREMLPRLSTAERTEAVEIMLRQGDGLATQTNMAEAVLETWKEFVTSGWVPQEKVLQHVINVLHFNRKEMPEQLVQHFEQLRDEIIGNDFSSMLRRYVAMDLLVDRFDEEGKVTDGKTEKIRELAEACIGNPEQLKPELAWLVTDKAANGYVFGYELAKLDQGFTLLCPVLDAQRQPGEKRTGYFIGGYLRTIFETDPKLWADALQKISESAELRPFLTEITFRSGVTDESISRILELVQNGHIEIGQLRMFSYGSVLKGISRLIFDKMVGLVLEKGGVVGVAMSLDFLHLYYLRSDAPAPLPADISLKALTHPILFGGVDQRDPMLVHNWTEVGKAFVAVHPQESLVLADIIVKHFGDEKSVVGGYYSPAHSLLVEILQRKPKEVWGIIVRFLGPPSNSRTFRLKTWLQGALQFVPLPDIWAWVDADRKKRAPYLSSFVPAALFRESGKPCLAREVLVRYGEDAHVRSSLWANFSTESFSGSRSSHYQQKKCQLQAFRKGETEQNVILWIDEYVRILEQEIERAKIDEERSDFWNAH